MKLTKKLEAEVLKVYKAYWDAYLNGKMKTFASMLDDSITVFGTATSEVFNNKKETLRFYKATADQLVGKAQFRNRKISVNEVDNNILVNEQSDLYILIDKKWTFYGHVRVSAILKHTGKGWKLIHQHASFPDMRAEEGEQLAAEKIKAENLQLRDAVKRRTIELEEKNRELEIETSLEKVRAQALGMHKADELMNVCKVLFKELIALGFTGLRNAIIHSFNDDKAYFTDYDYSDTTGGAITNISYNANPIIKKFIKQIRKSDNAFVQINIKGNELKDWKRFRKEGGQPDDPLLNKASAIHYYLHSIQNASIGISTFNVISKEQLQLLKRFRNVFDFAYRRYMDIAQAEAQTREAQIEVAVERVRAKALAMHRSDEIHEVVRALRNELFGLKLEGIVGATICLKQADGQIRFWDITDVETTGRYGWDIVFDIGKIDPRLWVKKIWDSKKQIISTEQDSGDLKRALKWLGQYDKKTADEILKLLKINNIKHGWHRAVRLAHGRLITDFANEPPSEIDSILLKIGVAFDLAYRRFLDLQKAEAQAREAQIEAALEKIRSRSLAMHHSKELKDVIATLFERLGELNVLHGTVAIQLFDHTSMNSFLWVGNAIQDPQMVNMPYDKKMMLEDTYLKDGWEAMREGRDIINKEYSLKEKNKFFKYIFANNDLTQVPEGAREVLRKIQRHIVCLFTERNSALFVDSFDGQFFSQESLAIIKRGGKVFEQCYIRFLDLQKAEAQAREAQIEAALERVRAKTMAMHKSADLLDVVRILGEQFEWLGFRFHSVNFNTEPHERDWHLWLYNVGSAMYPGKIHIPYIDHPCFNRPLEAFKKGGDLHTFVFTKEEKDSLFDHIYTNSVAKFGSDERKRFTYAAPGFAMSIASTKNTRITLANYNAEPFSEEENAILRRFAIVFEQSYTRFLDLQKAEAQAREAQIEAALERVRSRSMGMQKSDELAEVVAVLYKQFEELDFGLYQVLVSIYDKKNKIIEWWSRGLSNVELPQRNIIPIIDHPFSNDLLEKWENGVEYYPHILEGELKKSWEEYLFTKTDLKHFPQQVKETMKSFDKVYLTDVFMKYGSLQAAGPAPLPDDKADILKRFVKVLDLAYTRMKDLQTAEMQTREAQIELGLERVRSRAMAMQNSDELTELIGTVFKELTKLDLVLTRCVIMIYDGVANDTKWWMANSEDPDNPMGFYIKQHDHPPIAAYFKAWRERQLKWTYVLEGQIKKDWDVFLFNETELKTLPAFVIEGMKAPDRVYLNASFNNFGNLTLASLAPLSDEHFDILLRFAKVFDLTYTRFNDLKQAEAQAKESRIQLALERVRARTMAMQKSDELLETSFLLFQQVKELGETAVQVSIGVINEESGFVELSTTIHGSHLPHTLNVPIDDPYVMGKAVTAWRAKRKSLQVEMEGQELKEYNEWRNRFLETKISFPEDHWIVNIVFFSKGWLSCSSDKKISDETFDLLKRFASVFEQTYIRFNDLKQAEAQAREARIETALEKVRSRTMGMQRSDELPQAANLLFQQIQLLGMPAWSAGYCIWDEDKNGITLWMSSEGVIQPALRMPLTKDPSLMHFREAHERGESFFVEAVGGGALKEHYAYLRTLPGVKETLDNIEAAGFPVPTFQIFHLAYFSKGFLLFITYEPVPEAHDIFKRFGKVFDQTYTRFLDLQKAEAQAHEARIEIALERIRARALAMHKSDELIEVAKVLWEQMALLGQRELEASVVHLYEEDPDYVHSWRAVSIGTDSNNKLTCGHMVVPKNSCEVVREWLEKFYSEAKEYTIEMSGAKQEEWYDVMSKLAPEVVNSMRREKSLHEKRYYRFSKFSGGALLMVSKQEPSVDVTYLQSRAAVVFDLAYRRFSDLQKAEAQAREAQIEAALERVRSRAMAMHKTDELLDAAELIYKELAALGITSMNVSYAFVDEEEKYGSYYSVNPVDGKTLPFPFVFPHTETEVMLSLLSSWKKQEPINVIELDEKATLKHQTYIGEHIQEQIAKNNPEIPFTVDAFLAISPKKAVIYNFNFAQGYIFIIGSTRLTAEQEQIVLRFTKVFELTYRRFLDLKKAEAQAKEARIEAALERVRSRAMAMHSSQELKDVALELRNQMGTMAQRELEVCAIHLYEESPDYFEAWAAVRPPDQEGTIIQLQARFPKKGIKIVDEMMHHYYSGKKDYVLINEGDKVPEWLDQLKEQVPEGYDMVIQSLKGTRPEDTRTFWSVADFQGGALVMTTYIPPNEDARSLLRRFSNVFGLAYRRFVDLKQAEAQAREAQIELALERVRAKAMAMHKSEDLHGAVKIMFEEFQKLNLDVLRCGVGILNKDSRTGTMWATSVSENGLAVQISARESFDTHHLMRLIYEYWQKQEDLEYVLQGKDLVDYYRAMEQGEMKLPKSQLVFAEDELHPQYYYGAMFTAGGLYAFRHKPFVAEDRKIMKRFASVVNLTYNRFLDLQRAETNAREAQIEASLERVRSKTMAMHNSQDVGDTVATMFDELVKLGVETVRCGIAIIDEAKTMEVWTASSIEDGSVKLIIGQLDMRTHPLFMQVYDAWKQKKTVTTYELIGEDLKDYFRNINNSPDYPIRYDIESLPYRQSNTAFMFPEGSLFVFSQEPLVTETIQIFKRFAGLFGQTYRRFLDLQKAEANAREAQIEAGLERVRARTMAMHSSDDVSIATATMFTELEKLGIENFRGGITNILTNRTQDVWSVNNFAEGKVLKAVGAFNIDAHPFWQLMFKEWQAKKDFTYYFLTGNEKEEYVKVLNASQGYLPQAIQQFPDVHFQVYYFNEGAVWTNTLQPHSEDDKQVMKKFASVFSLTFRRYQDLKKAEAQAREATIEAALEKVRGRAMAMHNSNDLSVTTSMIITELRKLGIKPIRCGVGIINKETYKAQLYTATSSVDGDSLSVVGWALLKGHPVLEEIYEKWLVGEDYFPELSGDSRRAYYEQLLAGLSVPLPDFQDDQKHYGHFFAVSVGCLYAWADVKYNDDEIKILKRFASIIDLTFRRYFELQKSEENARAAVKQAALDRIRADIASMRTISDLDRITPLIWNELTILGIPFIRCGVFIMDETQKIIHTFLSTPDGKAIAAFHLPYDTPGNFADMLSHWYNKKTYISRWGEIDFIGIAETLVKQGAIADKEQYLASLPRGGFYLHFLPFLQGMLYVGNTTQLREEEIELIQHVADAFSTAYARYEDFNKLEAAKQQVEKTLTDLKQAQTQLVQSEKMASLGELTAGIAHEIQNPLNFVNNFSDVSNELLEEMKIELEKGNAEDAMAIVDDVKQNLEKILHHGKRADAIVKGMLQHSRTSSGQKEPTDINILADEYLRLAFHGLRAKDKSFSAKFETEFDNSIGKINVIPQDIGRVILNLINNAFYAVTEKKKHASTSSTPNGYEPTVTVTTKKENGKVEITVRDNGDGIPQKVLDKIFQPFFTTKPTGQGTGLGLSLSYDIITKGHSGELKVETKEGEGSEFIIQLPAN